MPCPHPKFLWHGMCTPFTQPAPLLGWQHDCTEIGEEGCSCPIILVPVPAHHPQVQGISERAGWDLQSDQILLPTLYTSQTLPPIISVGSTPTYLQKRVIYILLLLCGKCRGCQLLIAAAAACEDVHGRLTLCFWRPVS